MTMHINKAGKQEHSFTIQFLSTFFQLWSPIIIYRQSGITNVGDLHDPVFSLQQYQPGRLAAHPYY
jgi:hypothetical protein